VLVLESQRPPSPWRPTSPTPNLFGRALHRRHLDTLSFNMEALGSAPSTGIPGSQPPGPPTAAPPKRRNLLLHLALGVMPSSSTALGPSPAGLPGPSGPGSTSPSLPPSVPSSPRLARGVSTDSTGSGFGGPAAGARSRRVGSGRSTLLSQGTFRGVVAQAAAHILSGGATTSSGLSLGTGVGGPGPGAGVGGGRMRHRASLFEAVKRTRLRSRLMAVATFTTTAQVRLHFQVTLRSHARLACAGASPSCRMNSVPDPFTLATCCLFCAPPPLLPQAWTPGRDAGAVEAVLRKDPQDRTDPELATVGGMVALA
jgi:hypothetical protein